MVTMLVWFGAAAPVRAQDIAMPAAPQDVLGPRTAPVKHVLVATYFDQGDANSTLKSKGNWTFSKGIKIACVTGCTVEFDTMVQVGNNKVAANQWEACAAVNSTTLANCPYQGTLPTNGDYVTGSYIGSITLKKSNNLYLLQPDVYVTSGPVEVANYHVTYRIFKP
jgi:hypothetical protein